MANSSNQPQQPNQPQPDNPSDDLDKGDLSSSDPAEDGPNAFEAGPQTLEFAALSQQLDHLWPPTATPHAPLVGRRLDQYDLRRVLGSGAFGVVYLAEDTQLRREVALKLPRPEVLVDPEKRQRFESEAALAASLDHPGIVPVYHAKLDGPAPYIASGYCEGPDLAEWLADQSELPAWRGVVLLVAQLADAIHYAHSRGIYHRDLKPANILLAPQAEDSVPQRWCLSDYLPLVTDFGLSKLADASLNDTRSSLLMGTPLYMAPEQIDRSIRIENEAAVDIYSLGIILFELLTGQPPVQGETYVEILDAIRNGKVSTLSKQRPDLPKHLDQVCLHCLETNPAARYDSAALLALDLRRVAEDQPVNIADHSWWDRFRWWSARPQRIRGAGVFTICLQSIWLFWTLFTAIVGSRYEPVPAEVYNSHVAQVLGVILFVHGCLLWLGVETLRGKSWAPGWGLGCTVFNMIGFVISIINGPVMFAELYEGRNLYYAFLIYCMLLFSFSVQAFLFWCAMRAQKARAARHI